MSIQRETHVCLRPLVMLVIILAAGLVGVLAVYVGSHVQPPSAAAQPAGPFRLTLMEIMDTGWNSTIAQPQFSLMGANGLEPASNMRVPVHTLIQLTIISYDTPTPGSLDSQGKVTGTVGGRVFLINGTTAMGTSMAQPGTMGSNMPNMGTNVAQPWGQNVTSVPGSMLAHTFTIQQLGINIPVVPGDTEVAYLYFNQAGTFQWICLTPCGFGDNGMQGAMSASGWMEGQITVY